MCIRDRHRAAHRPRGDPADGRMQRLDRNLAAGHRAGDVEHPVEVALGRFVAGGDHAQHVGQRPNLHPFFVKGRGLDPGIFAVVLKIGVMGMGLAVVGVARAIAALVLVPGMFDAFLDPVAEKSVLIAGDRLEACQIALGDEAAGQFKACLLYTSRCV